MAKLADSSFVASIPEPIRSVLAGRLNLEIANPLASSSGLYLLTVIFLVPLLVSASFMYTLYSSTGNRVKNERVRYIIEIPFSLLSGDLLEY